MGKFKNKYRISSTRLPNWDYGWNAAYFITICTQNRECFFGTISDKTMILSDIGKIAQKCWLEIPLHFPFVELDAHITMPNHVHGIIIINKTDIENDVDEPNLSQGMDGNGGDKPNVDQGANVETQYFASVETQNIASLRQQPPQHHPQQPPPQPSKNKFGPQSQNLASIVRGFKIGVTKNARIIDPNFQWQARYHDHIIRNNKSFETIKNYIKSNPHNWEEDKFYIN